MKTPFRVQDIHPGAAGSDPQDLTALGNLLYFFASDGSSGEELRVSNGTTAGTRLVKDLVPGWEGSMPMSLLTTADKLFFVAYIPGKNRSLCVSDGTAAGTRTLTHGMAFSLSDEWTAVVGNKLFFVFHDGITGTELWISDGTQSGTRQVADLYAGRDSSDPTGLTSVGNKVFFVARGAASGEELWLSDGSAAGTKRVSPDVDFFSFGADFAVLGNAFLFSAGTRGTNGGRELWISRGTAADTRQVKDINASGSSNPRDFAVVNNKLFFIADDGIRGEELWISDGTAAGTRLVRDIYPGASDSGIHSLTKVGNKLFFVANDGKTGPELWVSDGTRLGTKLVRDLQAGLGSILYAPKTLTGVGNKLYFTFESATTGQELWRSDGTTAGTRLVADIHKGDFDARISSMKLAGRFLFFDADDGRTGRELWALDVSADLAAGRRLLPNAAARRPPATTTLAIKAMAAARSEGDTGLTAFTFTVTRTGALSGPSSAVWKVSGSGSHPSTADDFANQRLPGGIVTFAAGETTQTLTIQVSGDQAIESNESFTVTLSQATNATLSTASATATIKNDDLPLITLTVSPAVLEDGSSELVYVFSRTGPVSKPLTVPVKVGGTASLGKDYSGLAASPSRRRFTFAAGSSTTSVAVKPIADATVEPDETVALSLLSGTDYRIGTPGAVIGTIRNDDVASYVLTPSHSFIHEGQTLTTTVQTTGVPRTTPLYWSLSGVGLTAGDFAAGSLTGSGRVGQDGSFSFSHTLRNDATTELEESLQLTLYTDAGRTRAVGSPVLVTILDSSRSPNDPLKPIPLTGSTTLPSSLTSRGEVDTYAVDVISGAILSASVRSDNAAFYPLIHLKDLNGAILKNPIAYNGNSADLGMVDLLTGKALIDIKTQTGTTGHYVLNVAISTRESIKNDVFRLTNVEREKAGLAPLTRNSLLEQAAEGHVQDMDANNTYLAHTGSNGSSPTDRIKATGYRAAWVDLGNGSMRTISSENAASGYTSAAQVVQAWMNSSGHKAAILDPATKEIGVGFDYDNETGRTYWLQNFGYPWSPGMTQWF
jgi:ELWxxDGT repeat protein